MEGFEGIMPRINTGHAVPYNPGDLSLRGLSDMIIAMRKTESHKPKRNIFFVSPIILAYLNNDQEKIAYYERQERVYKISRFRRLIAKYGYEMAKTMAYLNEKTRVMSDKTWGVGEYGITYKGFGNGEMESVRLFVDQKEDGKFRIRLIASEDWGDTKYKAILSDNVSYKSILNQVRYFNKKLKIGVY